MIYTCQGPSSHFSSTPSALQPTPPASPISISHRSTHIDSIRRRRTPYSVKRGISAKNTDHTNNLSLLVRSFWLVPPLRVHYQRWRFLRSFLSLQTTRPNQTVPQFVRSASQVQDKNPATGKYIDSLNPCDRSLQSAALKRASVSIRILAI